MEFAWGWALANDLASGLKLELAMELDEQMDPYPLSMLSWRMRGTVFMSHLAAWCGGFSLLDVGV